MDREEVEAYYKDRGLEVEYHSDEAGKTYEPHAHGMVFVYTLQGGAKVRLDEADWHELTSKAEFTVDSGQVHEVIVGESGWEYVTAWDPEEAALFPDVHP